MTSLEAWHVLVPLGGRWASDLAARLREAGATATVSPLIEFEPVEDSGLEAANDRLARGAYDWLILTSATTVESLAQAGAQVPATTRVAVVGEHTDEAARAAGIAVDFIPEGEPSAQQLVAQWPGDLGRALLPQSEFADETLAEALGDIGLDVDRITAYRAVAVAPPGDVRAAASAGDFDAIVLTAGSVAARVIDEFPVLPETTRCIAIGSRTAAEAEAAGLAIAAIVASRSTAEVTEVLAELAARER